jgi:EAL domain-containing protein (putative c-di-GMP-specific phosphodiesterase class I)/GGDEF domain-containing protein
MPPSIPSNESRPFAAPHHVERLDAPMEPALDRLTRLAAKSLGASMALICLIDERRQWFKSCFGIRLSEVSGDDSVCAHAVVADDVLVVGDATQDQRFRDSSWVVGYPHVRFYAAVALRTAEGRALGALCVLGKKPRPGLPPKQTEMLRDLAVLAAGLIEADQGARASYPENSLPGTSQFLRDVNALLDNPRRVATETATLVINAATPNQYADLVRTLGHLAADSFEFATATRISELLPEHTRLYHLSPARFGCLVTADTVGRVGEFLEELAYKLQRPLTSHDIPLATSVGIGIAYFSHDGADALGLLRAATSAAHEALDSEKAWCAYSPTIDLASQRAAHLLRDIGPALASEGQLHLVYQPKMDLKTGRCVGAEALLRWTHPSLGLIGPSEFVGLIERTTLVHALTDWALGTALPQVARWRMAGLDLQISINVSMLDLGDEHFVARLAELLDRHAVQPNWIDIEVTESALMKDPVRVGRQLDAIRRLGVAIDIDDFGTGQSALSYLKYIPATYVKIDQLFIRRLVSDRDDQIMVRSTIDLVHELGRLVVAEGVTDTAAYDWLRQNGCDIGQGDAISPPLDVPSFERWLQIWEAAQLTGDSADR